MEGYPSAFEANKFFDGANLQVMKNEHGLFRREKLPSGTRSAFSSPAPSAASLHATTRQILYNGLSEASRTPKEEQSVSGDIASPPMAIGLLLDTGGRDRFNESGSVSGPPPPRSNA